MNTSNIKSYAPKARRDFIAAVQKQAVRYGVTENEIYPVEVTGDVAVVNGKPFPAALAPKIRKLAKRVEDHGYQQTMEQVAYSWFNRLVAIRYMELHDYLGHGRRVLSHPDHAGSFQILEECTDITYGEGGQLPNLKHEKVVDLKLDGTRDEELYRELLLAQCHALHKAMPFLFESIDDETELLLPENLTKTNSLIHELVNEIPEQDWQEVEIIGWLYQFYISEKKDQVIGKVVKSEDIPAATQLFTPNWIVKYMVQNSLGAQWLATYPQSPLKTHMEYYIEPAEQTDEVNQQLKTITPKSLNPEELTLIDPASGSGHILVEAYDLFNAIYLERGYRLRDVPQLILEKNLFGLDIDERAAQLTGFALMMKGRANDRRLFEKPIKLNVMALVDSAGFDEDAVISGVDLPQYGLQLEDLTELKLLFEHATTFGSLIQVPQGLAKKLPALKQLSEATSQDLFVSDALKRLVPLVQQAELLAAQYDAVVANPPYMGSNYHPPVLKKYLKDSYSSYEKDFFSAFVDRNLAFSKPHGQLGFMSPFVWMFISSYEHLRTRLINSETITSLVQLEYSGFDGATVPICTFTLQKGHLNGRRSCYIRLSDFRGSANQGPKTLEAISNRDCGWFFEAAQDEFNKIPGSHLAYWLSSDVVNTFMAQPELSSYLALKAGLSTGNNEIFQRQWQEVAFNRISFMYPETPRKWVPCNSGGMYRKWYGNNNIVVDWDGKGARMRLYRNEKGNIASAIRNENYYFREGLTWNKISSGRFAARWTDKGFAFDDTGRSGFVVENGVSKESILSVMVSNFAHTALSALTPTLSVTSGELSKLPVLTHDDMRLKKLVKTMVNLTRWDWNLFERSWDFTLNPLYSTDKISIEEAYKGHQDIVRIKTIDAQSCESQINNEINSKLSLESISSEVPIEQITLTVNSAYRYGIKNTEEERDIRFCEDTMQELISYAIGCMMGRYSLDVPGLIYAHSGNQDFNSSKYTTFSADNDGIIPITNQEWFKEDATNRFRDFISVAWAEEKLQQNLDFVAESLCLHSMKPKNGETSLETIRRYLCTQFYKNHLKTYKKRPIYWLFSSGKLKAFECLVYLHRYNEGTLARMRTEYVIPLTAKLNSHVEKLDQDKIHSDSASEIKKIEKEIMSLHKQQAELATFDEKLKYAADQRIKLDLDDGVKVNYGKFGDLLADVKTIHGKIPDMDLN